MSYTIKSLREDIIFYNQGLEKHNYKIKEQSRNGYQAVDLYSLHDNKCLYNLECGTSNECFTAILNFVYDLEADKL